MCWGWPISTSASSTPEGIDQLTARADLEAHLEDPHTVAVLCSGFNDAPEYSIHHLLRRARDINNRQIGSNCAVLVLARPGEAKAVKDGAGDPVEMPEDGYELKAQQVANALVPYRLRNLPVHFFNAFEDDPDRLRNFLHERVLHTRAEFRRQLSEVLGRGHLLLASVEQEQVRKAQEGVGRHLAAWITQHPAPAGIHGQVHDTLLDEIGTAYAATVHAAIRRYGEWRALSYTHQLGHGARKLAVAALRESVTDFTNLCATLTVSSPEAAELLSQAVRLMAAAHEELLRKMQVAGETLYRDQFRQDPRFWRDNEREWGNGPGYLDRVVRRHRDWFELAACRDLEMQLEVELKAEWTTLLERVGSIFEASDPLLDDILPDSKSRALVPDR
jgi:hypothetical protein